MNVLFVSPHFPPQFWLFCAALKAQGATVLGIGDAPWGELAPRLQETVHEYVCVPGMGDYAQGRYGDVLRAVAGLISRHGRIERIDSMNEFWLPLEAMLREDFNVPGPRPATLTRQRSKSGMRELFRSVDVPCTLGEPVESPAQVQAFAARHGYPLVLKPDVGVGAARTYRVDAAAELDAVLPTLGPGYLVEAFAKGTLVSYDGLVDRDGRVVFETSHVYCAGVMDIVNRQLDVYYYSRRVIPPRMRELGRRVLDAFAMRERFFHIEFFEQGPEELRALEINLRPPGGFTTDLMNYSADIDVYALWAKALLGRDLSGFRYDRKYFAAHVSRRNGKSYRLPNEVMRQRLGDRLILEREIPAALSGAMGNHLFIIRSPDEADLLEAIRQIHATA